MKVFWDVLSERTVPVRDSDDGMLVWKPKKGWLVPSHHMLVTLTEMPVRRVRRWVAERARKLPDQQGGLLITMVDPRIWKGGDFVLRKGGAIVQTPLTCVGHVNIVRVGLVRIPDDFCDIFEGCTSQHPKLDFTEIV